MSHTSNEISIYSSGGIVIRGKPRKSKGVVGSSGFPIYQSLFSTDSHSIIGRDENSLHWNQKSQSLDWYDEEPFCALFCTKKPQNHWSYGIFNHIGTTPTQSSQEVCS